MQKNGQTFYFLKDVFVESPCTQKIPTQQLTFYYKENVFESTVL